MNKTIVIIGAGKGISYEAAKNFGLKGYKVALISRTLSSLQKLENELAAQGITAKGFQGDVSSVSSLKDALSAVREEFGDEIEILLYNAASIRPGQPTTILTEDFIFDFKVNVAGALSAVQEVLPFIKKETGSILLTGGGLALHPNADVASLSVGKAGLRNLAHSLHQELTPKGVYVGTLTINGYVQEDTYFSGDKIAEALFMMHENKGEVEVVYREA
ncbi:SDR family NAD(P)-dependent oxidoreductase [Rossellomorea aquimaris]|uniref:SDR family NAD(P)-dependent oxidoreductase n=1 Tax=Rossellomorea aquimaris TaxID=189382 RepID=UPI001CD1CFB7|nr:SDR family NAD(P)-dependent oxidoreductase [Rossellomorea aquimaris]MCA1057459.1 SDR family NAD(P)-dependent oxidoreductase [Rossellomorea aquimaris]